MLGNYFSPYLPSLPCTDFDPNKLQFKGFEDLLKLKYSTQLLHDASLACNSRWTVPIRVRGDVPLNEVIDRELQ